MTDFDKFLSRLKRPINVPQIIKELEGFLVPDFMLVEDHQAAGPLGIPVMIRAPTEQLLNDAGTLDPGFLEDWLKVNVALDYRGIVHYAFNFDDDSRWLLAQNMARLRPGVLWGNVGDVTIEDDLTGLSILDKELAIAPYRARQEYYNAVGLSMPTNLTDSTIGVNQILFGERIVPQIVAGPDLVVDVTRCVALGYRFTVHGSLTTKELRQIKDLCGQ